MFWKHWKRWEKIVFVTVLVLAVFTRFYILGARVMSHDESLHTKYSWQLYAGQGYAHNPMMHGPLLFHLNALAYFLLGVNDFTSRVVPALFGVVLVLTPWLFRRWLKPGGTIATSVMLLLSPAISYYSRYIRHDVHNMLAAVFLLWTFFQYLDRRKSHWLYGLAAAFSLLYTTKETSYIYTAIFGLLLFVPFALRILTRSWANPKFFNTFLLVLALSLVFGAVFGIALMGADVEEQSLDEAGNTRVASAAVPLWGRIAVGLAAVGMVSAAVLAYLGVGEEALRAMPLFDVLMTLGALTLPLGAALIIHLAGVDMLSLYDALMSGNLATLFSTDLVMSIIILVIVLVGSIMLGLWWDPKRWPIIAGIHYGILIIFYTTVFTNAMGLLSGLVGALAYWLAQHGVERGNQPGYYYLLIMPLYEYLPILFSVGGGIGALAYVFRPSPEDAEDKQNQQSTLHQLTSRLLMLDSFFPLFLLGWTVLAWVAYTYAGEKMPWLTVHIALPSIFLAGWGLGQVVEKINWQYLKRAAGWLFLISLPLIVVSLIILVTSLGDYSGMESVASEAGPSLTRLLAIGRMIGGVLGLIVSVSVFVWSLSRIRGRQAAWLAAMAVALILSLLTVRTMVTLNYYNYDLAKEYLVYAHAAPDVKVALEQIREVSWRVTGAPHDVQVAYSDHGSWPFTWYFVNYPNAYFYGTSPDAEKLLESPVVIAGSEQWEAVDPILGNTYIHFDYNFLWWPVQDYFNLTWERLRTVLADPGMRAGLWDIIWNRDYQQYAKAKTALAREVNPDAPETVITLKKWPHRNEFRLYVRKNLAQEIWSYALGPEGVQQVEPAATALPDPYAGYTSDIAPDGTIPLPEAMPRGLTVAPDGTLYIADTANHRIWHVDRDGGVLHLWGEQGTAPGQFQEPWDVVVDSEGDVYVTDTWNHRVQKFDVEGEFLLSWGTYGEYGVGDVNGQGAFYGPRGIALGPDGQVYVTDTGNKRVQVFNRQGDFLWEFGGGGEGPGQLDEPVGLAISETGEIYVADTWNTRIQVFTPDGQFARQWTVPGWDIANPEFKPFVAVDDAGTVYVSDSGKGRVLVFDDVGTFRETVGGIGTLQYPVGVTVSDDQLYVADAHQGYVISFPLP